MATSPSADHLLELATTDPTAPITNDPTTDDEDEFKDNQQDDLVDEPSLTPTLASPNAQSSATAQREFAVEPWADVDQELIDLAEAGDWDEVNSRLDHGKASSSCAGANNVSLCHLAVMQQDRRQLQRLLEEFQANPCIAQLRTGRTPLHEAVLQGEASLVELLLHAKAEVGALDKSGYTPLLLACARGLTRCARLLVEKGDESSLKCAGPNGETPVMLAAAAGNLKLCQYAVERLGDAFEPHATDDLKRTLLFHATSSGTMAVVKWVVDTLGVDVNYANAFGMTPLLNSADQNHWLVFGFLLRRGADPHVADETGNTVLMEAAVSGECEVARSLITEHGLDVFALDKHNRDAFSYAASSGHWQLTRVLVDACDTPTRLIDRYVTATLGEASEDLDNAAQMLAVAKVLAWNATVDPRKLSCFEGKSLGWIRSQKDVDTLAEQCKNAVNDSPLATLAALRMVSLFRHLGARLPRMRDLLGQVERDFVRISTLLWERMSTNDFGALILEERISTSASTGTLALLRRLTGITAKNESTMMDLIFSLRHTEICSSSKVDEFTYNWWSRTNELHDPCAARAGLPADEFVFHPLELFRVPRVQFWTDVFSFLLFLAIVCVYLASQVRFGDDIHDSEYLVLLFGVAYVLREASALLLEGWDSYIDEGWNKLDLFICLLLTLICISRFFFRDADPGTVRDVADAVYSSSMVSLSLAMWSRSLFVFTINESMGVLTIIMRSMVVDMLNFAALLFIFFFACFFGLMFLLDVEDVAAAVRPEGYGTSWWTSLTFVLQSGLGGNPVSMGVADMGIGPTRRVLAETLASVYILAVTILLVNLLIAVMSHTYSQVRAASHGHFLMSRALTRWRYSQSSHTLPPPFNIIATLVSVAVNAIYTVLGFNSLRGRRWCAYCHRPWENGRVVWTRVYNDDFDERDGAQDMLRAGCICLCGRRKHLITPRVFMLERISSYIFALFWFPTAGILSMLWSPLRCISSYARKELPKPGWWDDEELDDPRFGEPDPLLAYKDVELPKASLQVLTEVETLERQLSLKLQRQLSDVRGLLATELDVARLSMAKAKAQAME